MINVVLDCYIYGIRAIRPYEDLRVTGLLGFFCKCWFWDNCYKCLWMY